MSEEDIEPFALTDRGEEEVVNPQNGENIGHGRKTNTPDFVNMTSGRSVLTGWSLIEEWMKTLDKGMVSDFNDDINTLLTFAGLFSAVLAGFLVQLYVELQPGNNQETNNILTQVSSELQQISHLLVNSSLVPADIPLQSPGFQASASTVWINTLWFLSLILSLSSALFGMISKQWLREYLRWTTMSGLSKDQVGLRQGRYEAFKDWHAPTIIASMPVLLEIAVIMFFLGMEILLWTLNIVVFGVCTVAIIAIVLLVITTTVLPVFRAWCPYKSPVGWAVIIAKRALSSFWNRSVDLLKATRGFLRSNAFAPSRHYLHVSYEKDWRSWDLSWQRWSIGSLESMTVYVDRSVLGLHRMQARALLWIAETSQDQGLLRAVEKSIAGRTLPQYWTPFDRLAADFHIACEYLSIDPSWLVPPIEECADADELDAARVIDISGTCPGSMEVRLKLAGVGQRRVRSLRTRATASVCGWIGYMFVCDLLAVVNQFNEDNMDRFGKQADYLLQASGVLCGALASRPVFWERRPSVTINRLAELFNHLSRNYDVLSSRLKPVTMLLAVFLEQCDGGLPLILSSIGDLQRTRCALQVLRGPPSQWSEADCSVFARLAQFALREWHKEHDFNVTTTLLSQLLDRMTACVLRRMDQHWEQCALADSPLQWIIQLRRLFDPDTCHYNHFSGQHLPPGLLPHALVEALGRYNNAGPIALPGDSKRIAALAKCSSSADIQQTASGEQADNASDRESRYSDTLSEKAQPQTADSSQSSVQALVPLSQTVDTSVHLPPPSDYSDAIHYHLFMDEPTSAQRADAVDTEPQNLQISTQNGPARVQHYHDESPAPPATETLDKSRSH